jgi:1,3-beta-glucanosyltransferase GAS5
MTSLYSGGLVYEYTMAENKFGIVEIRGNSVRELPEFATLAAAFKNNPAPSDNGGYQENLPPSPCPVKSETWKVQNDSLPSIPDGAKKYFDNGAGSGPGIKTGDKGSQWAGTPSSGWGAAGNSPQSNKKKSDAVSQIQPAIFTVILAVACLISLNGP